MKLRPVITVAKRKRRRFVWTSATVIVAVVWVSSAWWFATWGWGSHAVLLGNGAVEYDQMSGYLGPKLSFYFGTAEGLGWWIGAGRDLWRGNLLPAFSTGADPIVHCVIPLWIFLLPTLILTARAWLARPLHPAGCSRCGYDLTGLAPGAVCPECGERRA